MTVGIITQIPAAIDRPLASQPLDVGLTMKCTGGQGDIASPLRATKNIVPGVRHKPAVGRT